MALEVAIAAKGVAELSLRVAQLQAAEQAALLKAAEANVKALESRRLCAALEYYFAQAVQSPATVITEPPPIAQESEFSEFLLPWELQGS